MASSREPVPVTPSLLSWARDRIGLSVEEVAAELGLAPERIAAWESGKAQPTYRQAAELADHLMVNLVVLFRTAPPEVDPVGVELRQGAKHQLTPKALGAIQELESRRLTVLELSPQEPSELVRSRTKSAPPETVAAEIRHLLPPSKSGHYNFKLLRALLENQGVMVGLFSRIEVAELRGFCIPNRLVPTIGLNSADAETARLFTMAHELGHIILGERETQHSLGDLTATSASSDEQWCNRFAAEFLAPSHLVEAAFDRIPPTTEWPETTGVYDKAVKKFGVSEHVILVQLRGLKLLTPKQVSARVALMKRRAAKALAEEAAEEEDSAGGPNPYDLQVNRLGHMYLSTVFEAHSHGQLSLSGASKALGVKPGKLGQMEDRFIGQLLKADPK